MRVRFLFVICNPLCTVYIWPEVEQIRKRLWRMFENHRAKRFDASPGAPRVLRLGFHGCLLYADGSGGCDGCIDWEGIGFRFDQRARMNEQYRVPVQDTNGNAGLEATVKSLESFYTAKWFNKKTQSLREMGKSRADLWALATIEAVKFSIDVNNKACNGDAKIGEWKVVCLQAAAAGNLTECETTLSQDIVFKSGRRDCISSDAYASYKSPKRNRFPKVSFNGPALTDWFKSDFGFNGRETVALMGAHTIGGLHPPVSGLFYSFTSHQEDAFNNQYYRNMVSQEDWFFEDNMCTQRGTSSNVRGPARWRVKASAAFLNKAPVEWIQEKEICYNCDWAKTNQFPATLPWFGRKKTREACEGVQDTKICIPGTEVWRFNWGRDDAGTQADLGMLLDFKVDEEGFPYGCQKLDPYGSNKGGYYELKNGRANKLVAAECELQMHEEPPTSDGSNALSKIIAEFAKNKQAWLDTFVPTLEKMLANGYTDSELHLPDP